jgi:Tol biopolymer transport system component
MSLRPWRPTKTPASQILSLARLGWYTSGVRPPLSIRLLAVCSALFSLVPMTIQTHGSQGTTTKPTERVVFAWERDGNIDLYLANLDGTGLKRLTRDPAADELPRCSADGRQLLFRRGGSAAGDLFRLQLDTLEETRLTNDAVRDSNPQWSNDGRHIYATKRVGGFDRIVSLDTSGQNLRVISEVAEWHDVMPSLSADGNQLVHHTYRYGKDAKLQVLNLVDGRSRRLTAGDGNDYEASFVGNDGVVFSSNRAGGYYRIYFMPLAGSQESRLLADTGADAWGPRPSVHTGDVLFHTGKPGAWRLKVGNVAGGPVRPLFDDGTSKSTADWCPLPRPG